MNKYITKHKRLLIIVLISLIIIGVAYYFTLGKDLFQNKDTSEGADSSSGSNSNSTPSSSDNSNPNSQLFSSGFPLKWGIKNSYTTLLQKRLNLTITTCITGSSILEDGILGNQTLSAIQKSFPNIGNSVATNKQVSKTEYDIIINSNPGC